MMPIIMPVDLSGGGVTSLWVVGLIFIGGLYLIQLLTIYCMLFLLEDDDIFKTKKDFWLWHIPFIPIIFIVVQKIKRLK